jgi:hypothetical protein
MSVVGESLVRVKKGWCRGLLSVAAFCGKQNFRCISTMQKTGLQNRLKSGDNFPMTEPEPLRWNMTLPDGQPLRWGMGNDFVWNGKVPARYYQPEPTHTMSQNLIAADLAPALVTEVIADITATRAKMPFVQPLAADAKKRILEKGLGNAGLCDLFYAAAQENAGQLAASFPMAAWQQDRNFITQFRPIVEALEKLASDARDTLTAAESDDYAAGREAYDDLKRSAVGPAIEQVRAVMRERHGRRNPPPAPPSAA